jgi:cysteine-rich repeat protein
MSWHRCVVLASLLALSACIEDHLVPCGSLACPIGTVCTAGGCASPEAAGACAGKAELEPCTYASVDGTCFEGSCHSVECGNGIQDAGEACDDGNNSFSDGCSADCLSDETCGNDYIDALRSEQCDDGPAGLSGDGCTSTCTLEIDIWREVTPTGLEARTTGLLAFDTRRGVVVLFGGFTATAFSNETWEWNDVTWRRRVSRTNPPGRLNHSIAYDEVRQRVVVFGGETIFGSRFDDTWEWDGIEWVQRMPATRPAPRTQAAMAYDPVRQRIVLFGGSTTAGRQGETWEWDGSEWTLIPVTGPTARVGAHMAFDPVLGKIVLFGGFTTGVVQDTWTWDGVTWTLLSPSTKPSARVFGAMTTCGSNIVLFGGSVALFGPHVADTWTWTGTDWSSVGGSQPPARNVAGFTYDAAHAKCLLFGGSDSAPMGDTWELAAATWTERTWAPSPVQLSDAGVVYDPLRGRVVLFGGRAGGVATQQTWEWAGKGWMQAAPATSPPARTTAVLAFHEKRGSAILFAGGVGAAGDDMWEWDGTTWHDITPITRPPPRQGHAMTYDRDRDRLVVFGGVAPDNTARGDIWEWDGTTWLDMTPASGPMPEPRRGTTLAYDATSKRSILVGGYHPDGAPVTDLGPDGMAKLTDVWDWNGAAWTKGTVPTGLLPRSRVGLAYDPLRRVVVGFGGIGALLNTFDHTFEYRDGSIVVQETSLSPVSRSSAPLAYDTIHHRMVVFSGLNSQVALTDTWTRGFESMRVPELCIDASEDTDADGFAGCADPDCFGRCAPLCPPDLSCDPAAPRCGDDACSPVEDYRICPADCAAPP